MAASAAPLQILSTSENFSADKDVENQLRTWPITPTGHVGSGFQADDTLSSLNITFLPLVLKPNSNLLVPFASVW